MRRGGGAASPSSSSPPPRRQRQLVAGPCSCQTVWANRVVRGVVGGGRDFFFFFFVFFFVVFASAVAYGRGGSGGVEVFRSPSATWASSFVLASTNAKAVVVCENSAPGDKTSHEEKGGWENEESREEDEEGGG